MKKKLHESSFFEQRFPFSGGENTNINKCGSDKLFIEVSQSDPIKLLFWETLFKHYPDMDINCIGDSSAIVTRGFPITLNTTSDDLDDSDCFCESEDDDFESENISLKPLFDLVSQYSPHGVLKLNFIPQNETESIIFNALRLSIDCYLSVLPNIIDSYIYIGVEDLDEQFIITPTGNIICVDPIFLSF